MGREHQIILTNYEVAVSGNNSSSGMLTILTKIKNVIHVMCTICIRNFIGGYKLQRVMLRPASSGVPNETIREQIHLFKSFFF